MQKLDFRKCKHRMFPTAFCASSDGESVQITTFDGVNGYQYIEISY